MLGRTLVNLAVDGEDMRLVTVVPNNNDKDVFHVRRGCLVQNLNFAGATSGTLVTGACVAFPPLTNAEKAVTGYIALGPANEGPRRGNPALGGRYKSPYVRNCTNFIPDSIGAKIDGFNADEGDKLNTIGVQGSFNVDSYTQINQGGIGVSISNEGYAQLVSIFTIASSNFLNRCPIAATSALIVAISLSYLLVVGIFLFLFSSCQWH